MNTITKGKLSKRRKELVEFGADNLDNTAPVKKILEDLQHKNEQAFALYCQTIRPRKAVVPYHRSYHFTYAGHPLYAFPADWDGDLNSGYFEPFTYKSVMPKILTPMQNIDKSDPVTDYLKLKRDWKDENQVFHKIAACKSIVNEYESLNEEVVSCPKLFVDMAAHLEKDPDPYFDDTYNWYYTGHGNIQLICIEWVDYILHSVLNMLYLTRMLNLDKNEVSLYTDYSAKYDCGEDTNILETIHSANNMVVLRTKHKILILKISTAEDKIVFEKIKAVESDLPFTGVSFDGYHKNILYITRLDGNVSIVNLDRLTARTVKMKAKIQSLVNNWSAVVSSDRLSYIHVSRTSISTYDKRSNNITSSWTGARGVADYSTCNDITSAKQTETNSLYFTTDHHLFLLDLRNNSKSGPKILQRWTHGMQCVPTYISLCNFEYNKELVCLSSQWCEDTCVIPNYNSSLRGQHEIAGVTMPYRVPNILTTLSAARQKLLCHDLYNPIDSRLSSSITGQKVLECGENYTVLVQNSLGDISCATLCPEHMESLIEDDGVESIHEWSKLYQLDKKQLEISAIKDIAHILQDLRKVPPSYILCDSQSPDKKINFDEKEINQVFEKEELDDGLLDAWKETNETTLGESTLLNLHYSDDSLDFKCE